MDCPKCGYEFAPFETSCPRCANVGKILSAPVERRQEVVAHPRYRSGPPSDMTPLRVLGIFILFAVCAAIPYAFGLHVWKEAQVSIFNLAVKNGDLNRVKRLAVATPTLISAPGYLKRQPLFWAAFTGQTKVAGYLLEQKTDIEAADANGWTPLFGAAYQNRLAMVQWLVDNGADWDAEDRRGRRPIHAAAEGGGIAVAKFLISLGASPNVQDLRGMTPLHVATAFRQKAMVNLLIDSGADVNARTKNGDTPLRIANHIKLDDELIDILMAAGAGE